MLNNKIIFLILIFLLALLFILSQKVKEGFSDFDDKIDIKSLDDKEFKDNKGGVGMFKDKFASHEILDLYKPKNLKYGKIGKLVPMTPQSTLVKPEKIQQLQFLEKLKDISRVTEVQFKETKLTSLYPASLKQGQPYNVGKLDINDSNTLDITKNTNEIMNRNYETNNKNNNPDAKTQTQKFTKMITDAKKSKM